MLAGRSTARTIAASMSTADASPTPTSLKSRELSVATIENTPIITAAALVTVARIASETASSVISRRSKPSPRPRPACSSALTCSASTQPAERVRWLRRYGTMYRTP